jgi:hypothetical protein
MRKKDRSAWSNALRIYFPLSLSHSLDDSYLQRIDLYARKRGRITKERERNEEKRVIGEGTKIKVDRRSRVAVGFLPTTESPSVTSEIRNRFLEWLWRKNRPSKPKSKWRNCSNFFNLIFSLSLMTFSSNEWTDRLDFTKKMNNLSS